MEPLSKGAKHGPNTEYRFQLNIQKKNRRCWRHDPYTTISQNRGGGGGARVAYNERAQPPPPPPTWH